MPRVMFSLLVVSFLCLVCAIPAWADATLTGSQTRGQGSNGTLRCSGVNLPSGGTITSVSDSGAGFWLQSQSGMVVRYTPASKAVGTRLNAGTWYAYPNLPQNANTAGVTVNISTPSGGTQGEDTRSGAGGRER